jgi:hypothetical protein
VAENAGDMRGQQPGAKAAAQRHVTTKPRPLISGIIITSS